MKLQRPFPKPVVIGGIVAAGLVVLLIGWMLVISPQHRKAAQLDKDTKAVQEQIMQQLAAVAAAKSTSATAAPKIRVADVYKLAKAMPASTDMPDILLQLSQITKDSGVELQSIAPGGEQLDAATGQQSVSFSLSVVGDFFTVTDLLYRLRNLVSVRNGALDASGRLFAIDSIGFAPAGRKINATVTLHTYVYGAVASAAPVAPAAVPTGTSTDTTATTTTGSTDSSGPSATGAP